MGQLEGRALFRIAAGQSMADQTSLFRLWMEYVKQSLRAWSDRSAATDGLIKLATECYDADHQNLSARCLKRAAAVAENPVLAYSRLGQLYYDRENYMQARSAFEQAVAADFHNLEALRGLAMSLQMLGMYEEAIYYYLAVLAVEPKDFKSLLNLGILYHTQGRLDNAVELFRQVRRLDDKYEFTHLLLGRVLYDRAEYGEAEVSIKRAIQLNPRRSESYLYLGLAQQALGRSEEAVASYSRAVELDPKDAYSQLQLSASLAETDPDGAIAHARTVLRVFAGDGFERERAQAYWEIGWTHYLNREWEESVAASRLGLELDPTLTPVRFNLGLALLRGGRHEEARRVYVETLAKLTSAWDLGEHGIADLEKALKEDPSIEGAADILQLLRAKQHEFLAEIETPNEMLDL